MKNINRAALIGAVATAAVLTFASAASANTFSVSTCGTGGSPALAVNVGYYTEHAPNHITVTTGGTVVATATFTATYSHTFPVTEGETWAVDLTTSNGSGEQHPSGIIHCQATTTTTKPETPPSTTTTTPPSTAAPTTATPTTIGPTSTPATTSPPASSTTAPTASSVATTTATTAPTTSSAAPSAPTSTPTTDGTIAGPPPVQDCAASGTCDGQVITEHVDRLPATGGSSTGLALFAGILAAVGAITVAAIHTSRKKHETP